MFFSMCKLKVLSVCSHPVKLRVKRRYWWSVLRYSLTRVFHWKFNNWKINFLLFIYANGINWCTKRFSHKIFSYHRSRFPNENVKQFSFIHCHFCRFSAAYSSRNFSSERKEEIIEPELKDSEKKLASEVEVLTLEVTKLKETGDELLVRINQRLNRPIVHH